MKGRQPTAVLRWSSDYSPRHLAEDLAPDRAAFEMNRYQTRRSPEGLYRSAWNQVEYGLNRQIVMSDEARECHLDQTQALLGSILNHPKVHQDTMLGVMTLSTYIPMFKKRIHREEPSPKDCEAIYHSLGHAMRYLEPLRIDQPPQWQMTESAVLALSARTKRAPYLLYPSSPREENSEHAWLNHDSYFYTSGVKIPLQQKMIPTEKEYNEWVTILTLQPLVDKVLKRSGVHDHDPTSRMNYMRALIIAETSGEALSAQEANVLNVLSSAVVSHYTVGSQKILKIPKTAA